MQCFKSNLCVFLVPCAPQNVSAVMDCGSDSISLTWDVTLGALYYIATATDELGNTYTCNSVDLRCKINGLRCGASYSAYVISSNNKCNSSVSETVIAETGTTHTDIRKCNHVYS